MGEIIGSRAPPGSARRARRRTEFQGVSPHERPPEAIDRAHAVDMGYTWIHGQGGPGEMGKRVSDSWAGTVESGIRKYRGPHGQHWYRVQMGGRGKKNRRSQVCQTLGEATPLKAQT